MRRRLTWVEWPLAISLLTTSWGDWETYDRMRDFVCTLGTPA